MSADMGTFRVDVEIENPANSGEKRTISSSPISVATARGFKKLMQLFDDTLQTAEARR